MENSLKALLLAAGIVITCAVISLGFYTMRESNTTATTGISQIGNMNRELSQSDKSMYDNLLVQGSEVINAVNKFKSQDLSVIVETKKGSVVQYNKVLDLTTMTLGGNSSAEIKDAQKLSSASNINQTADFLGTILRDKNDSIVGIRFKQN